MKECDEKHSKLEIIKLINVGFKILKNIEKIKFGFGQKLETKIILDIDNYFYGKLTLFKPVEEIINEKFFQFKYSPFPLLNRIFITEQISSLISKRKY